ncbi:von Willebrand factor A domain-containing protein 2-like [Dendronephthya gigantea]|uniref:von Willebrand factor A domain-containing protein 2-like n=1 Tax=Dendronephthya gigantea TaxID=151771 RepID=UPI00106AEA6A|nr:von Willebrand factor A domain-containing protein 2-like [Dendronephthya gigantea]
MFCCDESYAIQKCKKVVDIAMVVDESGSIGRGDFEKIKTFVADIISRFSVAPFGAHFAAVKYSTRPTEVFSLTKYTNAAQLHTAVRNMNYVGGSTFTGKALQLVEEKIFGQSQDRGDVPNVLVVFSDGQSHDHSKAVNMARKMKEKGVAILCVAIGNGITVNRLTRMLQQISSKPEYTFKSSVNALNTIEDSLVKNMCETISACASQPCKNGGECVDDGNNGYTCKCSLNWEGKNCELPKWCPAASFSKWGCYKTPRPRPATAKLLFNRRNAIDWFEGWDKYLETIVCDCGKEAKKTGHKYFLIEFYGECWGYKDFDVNQPHAGAKKCWGKRPNYDTCIHNQKNPICVGTGHHGYVYQLD